MNENSEKSLFEQMKETEEYKNIVKEMSDEEVRISEEAICKMLADFEENILKPLKNL